MDTFYLNFYFPPRTHTFVDEMYTAFIILTGANKNEEQRWRISVTVTVLKNQTSLGSTCIHHAQ